jgi:hypothetical protein
MTFLDQITAHIGGLVYFKSDLFYYSNDLPVGIEDQYFIVLETENFDSAPLIARTPRCPAFCDLQEVDVKLLINGEPKRVRFTNRCVEIIQ